MTSARRLRNVRPTGFWKETCFRRAKPSRANLSAQTLWFGGRTKNKFN